MTEFQSNTLRRSAYSEQWANELASTYHLFGALPTATSTITCVANTAVIMPQFIDRPQRVTDIAVLLTTADADEELRVGLYEWNPVTRTMGALVKDFGLFSADNTGIVAKTTTVVPYDIVTAGWYCWAVVSDGVPVFRTGLAVDEYTGGNFTISTTTLLGITHYTAPMTTPIASGFPASGSALTLTAVTSNSAFSRNFGVLGRSTPLNAPR